MSKPQMWGNRNIEEEATSFEFGFSSHNVEFELASRELT